MRSIVVTLDVSQVSSPSKFWRSKSQKRQLMSVIREVSMSPRQTLGSLTSFLSSFRLRGLYVLLIMISRVLLMPIEKGDNQMISEGMRESRGN